jgi:hypothetical protein
MRRAMLGLGNGHSNDLRMRAVTVVALFVVTIFGGYFPSLAS